MTTSDGGNTGSGGTLTDVDTSTITVSAVADIVADSITTNEDTPVSFNVMTGTNGASADNFESGSAAVTSVTQGSNGSVTFAANGAITYTPNANFNGTDSFTYTVTSGGVTETATVTVTVTAVNDAPVNTLPATFSTNEDTSLALSGLLIADVDASSGTTTVTLGVTSGSLTATSGSGVMVTGSGTSSLQLSGTLANINSYLASASKPLFVPAADMNGAVTLTMTTSDGGNTGSGGTLTDVDTATITVSAVADIVADSVSTNEDTPVSFNVMTGTNGASADNFESGSAAVMSVTQGSNGSVTFAANGAITYTPNAHFNGSDSFTYTVTSGGVTETATVTVTINAVNDTPVGLPVINGTVTEDQTLTANVAGISDADGLGAMSYQWLRNGGAIAGATASTYLLGDADVGALMSVRVSYTDGGGTTETVTSAATAAVANVNDTPTGAPQITGTTTEGQTLSANTATIADADGLGLFSYQWNRDGVAISGATAGSYTLVNADVGSVITLTVAYTDANGTAETLTSLPTGAVGNVNDAPTGAPSSPARKSRTQR